jgi:hypothetical protein
MMRAKIRISEVKLYGTTQETIVGAPVSSGPYGPEGESEDNTYARYTPSGSISLTINNPALLGQIKQGDTFYVDFTKAE